MKTIFLTIDDCPSADFGRKLELLEKFNIPAVFFCIGKLLELRSDAAIDAIRKGYIIGNHSYSHPYFSDISASEACSEILRTDEIIDGLYRQAEVDRTYKYFRFPFGDKGDGRRGLVFKSSFFSNSKKRNEIQKYLRRLGYTQPKFEGITYEFYKKANLLKDVDWHWTFDVMEWNLNMQKPLLGLDSVQKVFDRMKEDVPKDCRGLNSKEPRWSKSKSDEIVLLHDFEETSDVFTRIVEELRDSGYLFEYPR